MRDREVWYLDHDYLEQMYSMFKKVNGKLPDGGDCTRRTYYVESQAFLVHVSYHNDESMN